MKKFIAGLLTGALLSAVVSVHAETTTFINAIVDQVKVVVNGQPLNKPTLLYENETYVSLRAMSEMLALDITWDSQTNTAYVATLEQPQQITPSEMEYMNKIFVAFDEIQSVLDDINNIVHNSKTPYDSRDIMWQVITMFNDVREIPAPESLEGYKEAVSDFCNLNIDIFKDLIAHITENPESESNFPEFFNSKYDTTLLRNSYLEAEDALFKFLGQRAVG